MIVKNEAKIIKETLMNIYKYIDYWVISDTGSNDNTVEIIKNTFNELNIPGEIFHDEWEDFGTNRTKALQHAFNKCDYIMIFDADDLIIGDLNLSFNMDKDVYDLKFGKNFTYVRPILLKSSLKWKYRGVIHEYLQCISDVNLLSNLILPGDYYIESGRLGNRNNDSQKYLKDVNILINAINLNKEPDLKLRYTFYTGQSFYDYHDYNNALIWYKKRTEEQGWIEEFYYANLRIAFCMENLNYDINVIINQYIQTYKIITERPEALYNLAIYYKKKANIENNNDKKRLLFKKSLDYLLIVKKQNFNSEKNNSRLFLNKEIYIWLCDYEIALINYNLENYIVSIDICKELLDKNELILNNLRYEQIFTLHLWRFKTQIFYNNLYINYYKNYLILL